VVARGSLLAILAALFLSDAPPTNPLQQIRLFCGLFAAPELAAWCVARAFAARARVEDGVLALLLRDQRIEVPLAAIAAVEPWSLPLPSAGVCLRLRSGRRLARTVAVADPARLVELLVAGGASPALRAGLDRAAVVFARARSANPRSLLDHPALKFVAWSLVPTIPVFRLHQHITYGGTFGEYYTYGLKAYLVGFGLWWASWSFNLLLLAAGLRAIVEAVATAAAVAIPARAVGVRRAVEIAQRVVYYVCFPAWLVLRLLS